MEIVRCKDCVKRPILEAGELYPRTEKGKDACPYSISHCWELGWWFCSQGKRKKESEIA